MHDGRHASGRHVGDLDSDDIGDTVHDGHGDRFCDSDSVRFNDGHANRVRDGDRLHSAGFCDSNLDFVANTDNDRRRAA
jgi:hypothetical protein